MSNVHTYQREIEAFGSQIQQPLEKHVGGCKCKQITPNCIVGQYYMSLYSQHLKKECFFSSWGRYTMANMTLFQNLVGNKKIKVLQFVVIFWLLKQSHLIIESLTLR